MSDSLTLFLAARLDEKEARARATAHPARELRDIAAKRALIGRYERAVAIPESVSSFVRGQDSGYREACLDAIKDLTAAYSDFPGYRQEWAP